MDKNTALKIAIEALETCTEYSGYEYWFDGDVVRNALKIAREALEQPAQQPLTKYDEALQRAMDANVEAIAHPAQKLKVLYEKDGIKTCEILPSPSWQGLDDMEMVKVIESVEDKLKRHIHGAVMVARAIEQELKEKNHG